MEVTGRDREFDRLRATGRAEKKKKKKKRKIVDEGRTPARDDLSDVHSSDSSTNVQKSTNSDDRHGWIYILATYIRELFYYYYYYY